MSLLRWTFLFGLLFLSITVVHGNETQEALQEAEKITEFYEGGVEIRTISEADIRDIYGKTEDVEGEVSDVEKAVKDLNAEIRDNEIFIELSAALLFDFDKADIKSEAEDELTKVATIIAEKGKGVVTIKGHTDSKGSESYNLDLSQRRAIAIHGWLITTGQVKSEFKIEGLGETQPVAPNLTPEGLDNPEGRAKNRRVEIFIETNKV